MASIYDKALKRKDFSGIMKKQDQAEKQETDLQTSSSTSALFSTATWFDFGARKRRSVKEKRKRRLRN
jgi:hypothetical protein